MTDYLSSDAFHDDDLQFKAVSGQLNVDEAQGIVECFVAAVGNKDSVGDIVAPGAFDGSLRRRKPRVVWGHDWNQPIGKVLAIEEVPASDPRLPQKMKEARVGGLLARVQFNLKSERGREAFHSVAFFGNDQEWSIGYKTIKAAYDPGAQANVLQEVELFEVSPVLHGANQLTGTISIKAANGDDRIDSFDKSNWPMFDRTFAAKIKADHPDIWDAGGNIKGDDQYQILTKIAEQGGKARTEDQIKALELREAWIARHKDDFRLPGVIAQIKWLAIGSRGESHMKKTVRDAAAKMGTKNHGWDNNRDLPSPSTTPSLVDDWTDSAPNYEEMSPHTAPTFERRVRMFVKPGGHAEIHHGQNRHHLSVEALNAPHGSALAEARPGIGNAISNVVGAPILLRYTDENFVIFDNGEDDTTYFAPYHFDGDQYMFGAARPVDVELSVNFDIDEDEDEPEGWEDHRASQDDDEDEDESYWVRDGEAAEGKAIGAAIGPVGPKGQATDPDEMIDHDGDGWIGDGTPNQQRARRKKPKNDQPMRREVTEGGQRYNVDNRGRRTPKTPKYAPGKGPMGPAGPKGRDTEQVENARAVARLERMRRQINRRGSKPGGERAASREMRDVGRFLRAAGEANARDRDMTIYEDGSGNATTRSGVVIRVPGYDQPKKRARAIAGLDEQQQQRMAEIDAHMAARRRGEQLYDYGPKGTSVGPKRQRGEGPSGPKGPQGRSGGRSPEADAAVRRLQRRRDAINRRGSTPEGERRAGREMQDVGRFLRAAEANDRARNGSPAGPAGARGPKANYGMSESGRTSDNYDGNAARQSRGFQQRYYDARTGKFRNMRTPFKSLADPALTIEEVEDLELKVMLDPALTVEDLIDIETKGLFGSIGRALTGRGDRHIGDGGRRRGRGRVSRAKNPLAGRDPRTFRDPDGDGVIYRDTPFETRVPTRGADAAQRLEEWNKPSRGAGYRKSDDNNAALDAVRRRHFNAVRTDPSSDTKKKAEKRLTKARSELEAMKQQYLKDGTVHGATDKRPWHAIRDEKKHEIHALEIHIHSLTPAGESSAERRWVEDNKDVIEKARARVETDRKLMPVERPDQVIRRRGYGQRDIEALLEKSKQGDLSEADHQRLARLIAERDWFDAHKNDWDKESQ